MNKLSRRQKWAIAITLLLFAAVKIAMLLWWQQDQRSDSDQVHTLNCAIRTGCTIPIKGVGAAEPILRMSDPISAKTPFDITLSGIDSSQTVTVSFEMASMDMGFNRYRLIPAVRAPNTLQALAVRLPICVTQRTDYIAVLNTEQGQYKIHFNAD